MEKKFTMSVANMTDERALKAADDIEEAFGEMMVGKRKSGNLPVEPIAVLVQFARNKAKKR